MIVGFFVVLVMTVAVVVDASAAYLRRQALSSLADGAALAAANGLQGEHVYTSGLGERAVLDPGSARELVASYLADVGAGRNHPGLSHSVVTRGERVVVRVGAPLDLPIPVPGVVGRTRVTATAAAVVLVAE